MLLIFAGMFMVMQQVFQFTIRGLQASRAKQVAVEIANAQMEIIRNIDYNSLGTVGGSPAGAIQQEKIIDRADNSFTMETTIRYYDDPFDGCAGIAEGLDPTQWSKCADGTVVEKARDVPAYANNPADYKKATVTVSWESHYAGQPVTLSTTVAPRDLEGDTDKGFMLIEVIDASGSPVTGADVHITNTVVSPTVDISMTTDSSGQVLLFDLEPSQHSYVVVVTKDGYTTDRTCSVDAGGTACTDAEGAPDPYLQDATVHLGELEELTFIIDRWSTLAVNSFNESCEPLGAVDFTLSGMDKLISVDPSIPKNQISFTTDTNQTPHWSTNQLEWDLYDLIVNTSGYYIAGINHDLALNILPNTSTTINVLLAPTTPNALLVTAKDSGSGTNLSDATVRVVDSGNTYDESRITGQGFIEQTDWSGGSGQSDYTDDTQYFSDDGNVDVTSTSGQISLKNNATPIIYSENFSTAAFKDGGNTDADWNVPDQELKMNVVSGTYPTTVTQHAQTRKINSTTGQVVSATLSAVSQTNGQTIRYYMSADGGTNFEEVTLPMGGALTFAHAGNDLRVRIEMETSDSGVTPVVSSFQVSFTREDYDASGELISSTIDLGPSAPALSEFTTISWQPSSQPAGAGTDSVRLQIATNTDNSTWNFVGPDGTASTYYTGGTGDIYSGHDGDRYVRYRVLLSTVDPYYTPTVTDIRLGYTLACLPPGQAYFTNAVSGSNVIEVHLDGYQDVNEAIDISGYTTKEILLTPIP